LIDERDRNKAVIEAQARALNAGDADGFAATHAEGGVNHAPAPFDLTEWPPEGKPFGPREARETLAWGRSSAPDLRVELEELLAEGDQVVAWLRMTGTAPTGRRVDFHHAQRFRLRDGLIVEHWAVRDDLRFAIQAGIVTPPGPPRSSDGSASDSRTTDGDS
jgi:ketosteroid isomerase-like protein